MEFDSLNFFLDHLASTGTTFSLEHRIAIQASLLTLCNDNHFQNVHFWGKILGTDNDYYIAYGLGQDYLKDRTYFYSINHGLQWILLPPPTPLTMELALASKGRFVGDPTADSETEIIPNDGDEIEEGEQWEYMKEEERLSATVAAITAEAAVVPRGALLKSPTGLVYPNKTFEGLSKEDALQLISFYHLRRPENPWDRHIVSRPDYNLTLDFLDSIANDLPLGCWTITLDKMETVATVRSLYWPGSYGVALVKGNNRRNHVCGWSLNGWWYVGTGKKNWDVPFMILPPPDSTKAAVRDTAELTGEDSDYYSSYSRPVVNAMSSGRSDEDEF